MAEFIGSASDFRRVVLGVGMAKKPDWEAFGKAVIGEWPGLCDLEASEVFDLAEKHSVVVPVPGGFDPDRHDDFHGVGLERGDPFYRYNFESVDT